MSAGTTTSPMLIDSFAWLEILAGTERGSRALSLMEKADLLATSVLNLYEVWYRTSELRGDGDADAVAGTIAAQVRVIPVGPEIALAAARIRRENRMSAVDCVLLATARTCGYRILAGDRHFEAVPDAVLI